MKITQEDGVTVVITTHYIEEAKQADMVSNIPLQSRGRICADYLCSE